METIRQTTAILFVCFLSMRAASGAFPRAQNVTWTSTNFKTILSWEPKPSADYSYTVEFSRPGGDQKRNPHCIRTSATVCDLSTFLDDLHACYTADVMSEPPLAVVADQEPPFTSSQPFCPFKDTDIGKLDFKLEVSKDKKKTTLYVEDPPTALFSGNRSLNIRDIFADQLQYRVTYRKNQSTGKKVLNSKTNVIELTGLDVGESYCFTVQAYIPSRSTDKQLGELNNPKCSEEDKSIFDEYSVGVIAAAIFFILLVIGLIIAITVICCKRRQKAMKSEKEGVPLRDV